MNDSPTPEELEPALLQSMEACAAALAREAGVLLLRLFQTPRTVEYKSRYRRDPVTDADRMADELLKAGIQRQFPGHGILSEETVETTTHAQGDFLWVLDPLDGTSNFMHRYPMFAVSLGVLYRGMPVVGALFIPSPLQPTGQVLHARRGGGAFADGVPVHVDASDQPSSDKLLALPGSLGSQFRLGRGLRRSMGDTRVTGSMTYEMALVASGVVQYTTLVGAHAWDVAGGIVVVREAGGEVLLRRAKPSWWEPFRSFLEPGAGLPTDGDMRKWRGTLVVGSPAVAAFVARNLRPRPWLWRWARRVRRRWYARSRAKEQPAQAPEEGRPQPPAGPPGVGQRRSPPQS